MDQQAGELLAALEASGRAENTDVIYLTDHGRGHLSEVGDLAEKSERSLIEEGVIEDQLASMHARCSLCPSGMPLEDIFGTPSLRCLKIPLDKAT